jgi:NAD(P)-dependent dehydrogenase (short-subunit alcohol dehydrogenase family)
MTLTIDQAVVAITGGARGIGAAIAREAARRGARVAIGDVDLELAGRTAAEIDALALPLDVTSRPSWNAFVADTETRFGAVDVLVNNAGIMPLGPFLAETDEATERQLDINVLGVLLGCKAALPGMLGRGRGHVINVASMAGKLGVAGIVTYSATKFAVVGLTQALADELKDTHLAVTAVLPGLVDTELTHGLKRSPFAREIEPSQVATAVIDAVGTSKGEVWVPALERASFTIAGMIPAGPRARIMRLLGVDDPMLRADRAARADYERRVAR